MIEVRGHDMVSDGRLVMGWEFIRKLRTDRNDMDGSEKYILIIAFASDNIRSGSQAQATSLACPARDYTRSIEANGDTQDIH